MTSSDSRINPVCPDCGNPMRLMGSMWGLNWHCTGDECRTTHGAHPDGSPVGSPADSRTRRARARAHDAFDRLWEHGPMNRSQAYAWMARTLGVGRRSAHIGSLDAGSCECLVAAVRSEFPELFPFDSDPLS